MGEQPHPWGLWGCRPSPKGWLQGCTVPMEPICTPGELRGRDAALYNLSVASIPCSWLSGALSLLD